MRRISEVLTNFSIPISIEKGDTSDAPENVECPICKDAGWLRIDAEPGHSNFGRLFKCQCLIRKDEVREAQQLIELSNLDSLRGLTFASFDGNAKGAGEALQVARDFARNPEGWIFFHGQCGVGKTHLAAAIANSVVGRNNMSVYFRVVPDLLDQLRATFDPENGVAYDDRFQQIRNAHLLVLDDLGTEHTTAWAREKLYQLVNHRYNEQLPTVVTSNQDFREIEQRILSRLLDTRLTTYVLIEADDYRLRELAVPRRALKR
jgi:DNA replication protein DnaC